MTYSRRDLGLLLPALASTAAAQQNAGKGTPKKLPSKAYVFENLHATQNGAMLSRAVLTGLTHTGYLVDLHTTELAAGQAPHAPHRHAHEEIVLLRSGQLEVTMNGQTTRVTPGSVVYIASNDLHGWKNPGPEKAEYFVMALGSDQA